MISLRTWPNFREGSAKEGVKVILDEQAHSSDVQYGKTKIFIRHPQTLLALETARSDRIPGICTLLQKVCTILVCCGSTQKKGFEKDYYLVRNRLSLIS